jgi:hypothetical protein
MLKVSHADDYDRGIEINELILPKCESFVDLIDYIM